MVTAAHQDGLLQLNISGAELTVSYCVLHSVIDQIAFQGCCCILFCEDLH